MSLHSFETNLRGLICPFYSRRLPAIVPWDDPTPSDIKGNASALALALPAINEFLASSDVVFNGITSDGVDVGIWTLGPLVLVLATNMNYSPTSVTVKVPSNVSKTIEILDSGGSLTLSSSGATISLDSVGTVGYILQ